MGSVGLASPTVPVVLGDEAIMQTGYPRVGCLTVQVGTERVILDPQSRCDVFEQNLRRIEELLAMIRGRRIQI